MTNALLYQYEQELEQIKGTVLAILLKSRIQEFYKNNGIRIQTMYEKVANLQREYFEIGENNTILQVGKEGEKKPVLKEGKTQEGFNLNYDLIMKEPVNIVF